MNLQNCTLCPRNCHADRLNGQTGYCGQTNELKAARAALHMWEEPCISGQTGSGTVFFSGCNMGCVYCQNHTISKGNSGKTISIQRLSEIFMELQAQNACNINLVTPTHFVPQIIEALTLAKNNGLKIPVVYNTSSYEKTETLKRLDGLIDIYLPDLKYYSAKLSKKYSGAEDYFTYAASAIQEMVRQTGKPIFMPQDNGSDSAKYSVAVSVRNSAPAKHPASNSAIADNTPGGSLPDDYSGPLMKKGVIVRHLTLPGCMADSKSILSYLYGSYKNDIYVSIMNQYTPLPQFLNTEAFSELNRTIHNKEYDELVDYAISLGLEKGFIQEGDTCLESFIPPFDCQGI